MRSRNTDDKAIAQFSANAKPKNGFRPNNGCEYDLGRLIAKNHC